MNKLILIFVCEKRKGQSRVNLSKPRKCDKVKKVKPDG